MKRICWSVALLAPLWAGVSASTSRAQDVVNGGVVYESVYDGGVVGSAAVGVAGGVETIQAGVVGPNAPWHAGYYHVAWGQPVALVVPPTATHQTNWGWGVGNTRVTPINPQFMGPISAVPTQYQYGRPLPTPYYVSDTLQFGVYYIRGPW